jgi:hypothetical protein
MSPADKTILQHMERLDNDEQRPFSYLDFLKFENDGKHYKMSHGQIRNKFSQFTREKKIIFCYKDKIAFYSLPGRKFGKDKLVTDNPTDIINHNIINHTNNKYDLYKSIRKHPLYTMIKYIPFGKRSIHDIHICFVSRGLWHYLSNIKYFNQRIDSQSKSISFGYFNIEQYLAINVRVQVTDTVNVTIKCSDNPIMLDFDGIMRLTEALTRVEERLAAVLNDPRNKTYNAEFNPSDIKISNKDDWIITLLHINRDSLTEYSGPKFHCSWKEAKNLFIRIYSKELKLNGKKKNIIRLEIQENPDILFKTLLVEFIRNDNHQRLIELLV